MKWTVVGGECEGKRMRLVKDHRKVLPIKIHRLVGGMR